MEKPDEETGLGDVCEKGLWLRSQQLDMLDTVLRTAAQLRCYQVRFCWPGPPQTA